MTLGHYTVSIATNIIAPDDSDVGLLDGGGVINKARSPSFQPIVHFEGTVREPQSPNYDLRDESTVRERSHPKR